MEEEYADNEPNYLMLAQIQLPLEEAENDAHQYDDEREEIGGFNFSSDKVQIIQEINHIGEVNKALQNPFRNKDSQHLIIASIHPSLLKMVHAILI